MSEKRIEFKTSDGIVLEGLICEGHTGTGAIITHPHPLYGGDMYNNVVEAIQKAYQDKGHSTLRFNFRGVGRSGGSHDNGNGEQQDVLAAVRFMEEAGVASVHLSGYSFGTWIIARVAGSVPACPVVMVSPPAGMLGFPSDLKIPALKLVVTGSQDEFAPPELVGSLASQWNASARFEIIDNADHFYFGYTDDLKEVLVDVI